VDPDHVLCVRLGHGANCSSVGSVVDTLFAVAAVGAAVFVAVAAALGAEDVTIQRPADETKSGEAAADPEDRA
jgi:hypothetical protein